MLFLATYAISIVSAQFFIKFLLLFPNKTGKADTDLLRKFNFALCECFGQLNKNFVCVMKFIHSGT